MFLTPTKFLYEIGFVVEIQNPDVFYPPDAQDVTDSNGYLKKNPAGVVYPLHSADPGSK